MNHLDTGSGARITNRLLRCGMLAGPFYLLVALGQILVRPGFDLTKHPLSVLGNGDLGWVQITNFILTGLLTIAGALGMGRVLSAQRSGTWGPRLLGVYGLGLIGAGIFVAAPMDGFPPEGESVHGTPASGFLHFVVGGIGFLGLIGACLVLAFRSFRSRERSLGVFSAFTGVFFLLAFAGIASGPPSTATLVAFWLAMVLSWLWLSFIALRLGSLASTPRA